MVFINLKKAYNIRQGTKRSIWVGNDNEGYPKKYINRVQDMYLGAKTNIMTCERATQDFLIIISLHQGSSISSFLFRSSPR